MKKLEGKAALITGSSQGIGRGIALALAEEGADVVVNYRSSRDHAERTAEEIKGLGREALVWQADVARRDEVQEMMQAALDRFGRLDITVANAGISRRGTVVDLAWEDVLRTVEVSQFGVFHTCQLAARQMVRQEPDQGCRGKILIISSILAEFPPPENGPYNMAKAAVNALAETLAAELAGQRINVNVINPGLIDTPGERRYATPEELEESGKRIPWGRLGTIQDIGSAAVYLVSPAADYVTGAVLRVDGGMLRGLQLPSE